MGLRSDCFLVHGKFRMRLCSSVWLTTAESWLDLTAVSGSFFVVPAKTPYQLCVTFLNPRFLNFLFFPYLRQNNSVPTSLRTSILDVFTVLEFGSYK